MASRKLSERDAQEALRRKIRKRVRNQSAFFKHISIYFTLFFIFIIAVFLIRARPLLYIFLSIFSFWMIGLIFHWLSAFVFHRFKSWEEVQYQKRLVELGLNESDDEEDYSAILVEKPIPQMKEADQRWNEGDFV
ncbi:MAG TPA: 2TM domain-containing protein [Membranihabitans sp.]|nr:2TM domain-containing protein [Membranihabitans sp.]